MGLGLLGALAGGADSISDSMKEGEKRNYQAQLEASKRQHDEYLMKLTNSMHVEGEQVRHERDRGESLTDYDRNRTDKITDDERNFEQQRQVARESRSAAMAQAIAIHKMDLNKPGELEKASRDIDQLVKSGKLTPEEGATALKGKVMPKSETGSLGKEFMGLKELGASPEQLEDWRQQKITGEKPLSASVKLSLLKELAKERANDLEDLPVATGKNIEVPGKIWGTNSKPETRKLSDEEWALKNRPDLYEMLYDKKGKSPKSGGLMDDTGDQTEKPGAIQGGSQPAATPTVIPGEAMAPSHSPGKQPSAKSSSVNMDAGKDTSILNREGGIMGGSVDLGDVAGGIGKVAGATAAGFTNKVEQVAGVAAKAGEAVGDAISYLETIKSGMAAEDIAKVDAKLEVMQKEGIAQLNSLSKEALDALVSSWTTSPQQNADAYAKRTKSDNLNQFYR